MTEYVFHTDIILIIDFRNSIVSGFLTLGF